MGSTRTTRIRGWIAGPSGTGLAAPWYSYPLESVTSSEPNRAVLRMLMILRRTRPYRGMESPHSTRTGTVRSSTRGGKYGCIPAALLTHTHLPFISLDRSGIVCVQTAPIAFSEYITN